MKGTTGLGFVWMLFAVTVLVGWLSVFSGNATAQGTQGQNAVCTSPTGCSTQVGTSAFVDASQFAATGRDFCGVLNWVIWCSTAQETFTGQRGLEEVTERLAIRSTAANAEWCSS